MMWLKVASTNKSPGVILQYYLEAINKANGIIIIILYNIHGCNNYNYYGVLLCCH